MKFNTGLLTLIATTSTYANTFSKLYARSAAAIDTVSSIECQNSINDLKKDCVTEDLNMANYDKICEQYKNPKCQDLYEGVDNLPGCKDIGEVKNLYQKLLSSYGASLKLFCTKDENGNICPLSKTLLEEQETQTNIEGEVDKEAMNVLNDEVLKNTCKSEICINSTKDYLNHVRNNNLLSDLIDKLGGFDDGNKTEVEEINKQIDKGFQDTLDLLDAQNCTSLIQYKSGANSVSIKLSTTLLAIAGLLYYLF